MKRLLLTLCWVVPVLAGAVYVVAAPGPILIAPGFNGKFSGVDADLDGNKLYYDYTNDPNTYEEWVSADKIRRVIGDVELDIYETGDLVCALPETSTDADPVDMIIKGANAYSQATVNQTAGDLILSAGVGVYSVTIDDWNNCSGDNVNLQANFSNNVLVEGSEWTAATDNATTATSLAAAADALSGFTAVAVGDVVYVTFDETITNVNFNDGDATCTTMDENNTGFVRVPNRFAIGADNGDYILTDNSTWYFYVGGASDSFRIANTLVSSLKDFDLADGKNFQLGGNSYIGANNGWNQLVIAPGSAEGNILLIGAYDANTKQYDHGSDYTNPALVIHSVEDPNTENQEFVSLEHNTTNPQFKVGDGYGDFQFDGDSGYGEATWIRTNREQVTFAANPGDASKVTTALCPQGSVVQGISARVSTAGTNCADMDIGDGVDQDRYGDAIAVTADTTTDNSDATADWRDACAGAACNVTVTGTNGAGGAANCFDMVVDLVCHYTWVSAQTSDENP